MILAICGAIFSGWMGLGYAPCWIAAGAFGVSAAALALLLLRPRIEIHETHLVIGRRSIPWSEVRRVDQTHFTVPLVVRLTLGDNEELLVIYPGDAESSGSLLRHLCRFSREAILDGVPYRQFWGEPPINSRTGDSSAQLKYPLLRPEDEEEVERMFQRLKSVGHLDSRNSPDSSDET
jgi:hypothetical protein